MKYFFFLITAFFAFTCSLKAAPVAPELDIAPLTPGDIGLLVYDIEAKKEVMALNQDTPFFYASNIKLLTTYAALEYLGRNFSFPTFFRFDPVTGTLYITSDGDPTLVMEDLWLIALDLRQKGVWGIKKVVVDDFAYGEKGVISAPGAENGSRAYLAYISPLSLNYNSVELIILPDKPGQPPLVKTDIPCQDAFIIENKAKTVSGKIQHVEIATREKGAKTEILITGTIGTDLKNGIRFVRKIYNPREFYVRSLLCLMNENTSVPIERSNLSSRFFETQDPACVTATHKSKDLMSVLINMNRYSSNFLAESILCYMGTAKEKKASSAAVVLKDLGKKLTGITPDIINGSGIGNGYNKVTPRFFIDLLIKAYTDPFLSIDFFTTLPVAGEEGTMKRSKGAFNGKMRAKTGSLSGIASLSGIMQGKSGKTYLFTFVINNAPGAYRDIIAVRDSIIDQVWKNCNLSKLFLISKDERIKTPSTVSSSWSAVICLFHLIKVRSNANKKVVISRNWTHQSNFFTFLKNRVN